MRKRLCVSLVLAAVAAMLLLSMQSGEGVGGRAPAIPESRICVARPEPSLVGRGPKELRSEASRGTTALAAGARTKPIRLVDVDSRQPVTGLRVLLANEACQGTSPPRPPKEYVSSSTGMLPVDTGSFGRLHLPGADWRRKREGVLEWQSADKDHDSGIWWLFRLVQLEGRVKFEGETRVVSLQTVRFHLRTYEPAVSTDIELESLPGCQRWMQRRGLGSLTYRRKCVEMDDTGHFHLWLPRIGSYSLVTSAVGWIPAVVDLSNVVQQDPVEFLEVILRRAPRVRGKLAMRSTGRPVPNARIEVVLVPERASPNIFRDAQLHGLYSAGYLVDQRTGRVHQETSFECRTDSDGQFDFPLTLLGQSAQLFSYVSGCMPVRVHLGRIDGDRSDIVVFVEEGTANPVSVETRGVPVAGGQLVFCDATASDVQPSGMLAISDGGSVAGCWFEIGHVYYVVITGQDGNRVASGHIRWSGLDTLELDNLKTLSAARRANGADAGSGVGGGG